MDSSALRGNGFVLPHGRDANDAGEVMDASSLPVEACANGVMDPSSLVNALGNDLFSSLHHARPQHTAGPTVQWQNLLRHLAELRK